MTKRKKENKLVVNWITREDILSSYFVPEERERVRKEQNIKNILSFYQNGASKDLIIKSTGITEKEFNDILKEYEKV